MVSSARVAYLSNRSKDYGVDLEKPVKMNMEAMRKRKRDIVSSFRGGSESRIQKTKNLELYMGQARFVGSKEIEITLNDTKEVKKITSDSIFINTGCRPALLDLPGTDEINVLDSTSIMELDEVPSHLIVIGGGYVGVEFAQMFKRFGANVTIVQRTSQLLGHEDIDVADRVKIFWLRMASRSSSTRNHFSSIKVAKARWKSESHYLGHAQERLRAPICSWLLEDLRI